MERTWVLTEKELKKRERSSKEALYTTGNGYLGCRGFFEEEQIGLAALGGIYIAGIFGKGTYDAWKGRSREMVNIPNFCYVFIQVDGEHVLPRKNRITAYERSLDMQKGILHRSYVWTSKQGKTIKIEFERFMSMANLHTAGQKISVTPISGDMDVEIITGINLNVRNLNKISCEPMPVQPGNRHFKTVCMDFQAVEIEIDGEDLNSIFISQHMDVADRNGVIHEEKLSLNGICGSKFNVQGKAGEEIVITKLVDVFTSRDGDFVQLRNNANQNSKHRSYQNERMLHSNAWQRLWYHTDIVIGGSDDDQMAVRYNIFQLLQACPGHDSKLSIGARGLTGEMYEGCVFWDTEIFMLPFFIYTKPEWAAQLLRFRYHCLQSAMEHAKDNWFEGAMYPWQSCEKGMEQTPKNVGAFYAIHIVADIAYALLKYWDITADDMFMCDFGAELLIETARFWASRVYYNQERDAYELLAVRGPNEYDVIVNNNAYTNLMAKENIAGAIEIIGYLKKNYTESYTNLAGKLKISEQEMYKWQEIREKMEGCYNSKLDLYEEDDRYFYRVPLDLKRAKPTAKRIIDSTMPYEALPLYQVTKQADIISLMNLMESKFTHKQQQNAWEYYEPKTAHDSSLSYAPHAIMAARLGLAEPAYHYFKRSAFLDIDDIKLNTISGLHFANFGGTWQSVVFGFAGLDITRSKISIHPHLPDCWESVQFRAWCRGAVLLFKISKSMVSVEIESPTQEMFFIELDEAIKELSENNNLVEFHING